MIEKLILEANSRFSLFEENSSVTVALSGGADSMALLVALINLREKLQINVSAAHLNHLIRGDEAFRDENFVSEQCKKYGIELFCERIDIPKVSAKAGISTELAARKERYAFLQRASKGQIATAHTASDNLETIIYNLSRGSSLEGLCGIPPKRDNIIRPLILCTREMIEEYCKKKNIPFVTDSTNLSDDYTRNKIRHNVIPLLKELNPAVEKSVLKTTSSLKEISDFIKAEAHKYIAENYSECTLKLSGFDSLDKSVAKRVIIEFVNLCDNEISLENCHIKEIYSICLTWGRTSIPKDKACVVREGKLCFIDAKSQKPNKVFSVSITDFTEKNKKINNLLLNNLLDCDKIIGKLDVRTKVSGDSIRLNKRGCTKPLTKLFNEYKIPVEEREIIPVIADDSGVIWIYGIGVAQRCAINEKSKNILEIKVKIEENQNGVAE